MGHLADIVKQAVMEHGDRPAVIDASTGRVVSYRTLDEESSRLAAGLLGLGLDRGARIGILKKNCAEWIILEAAIAKAGMTCVPINFRLSSSEIAWQLNHAGAEALVFSVHEYHDWQRVRSAVPDDVKLVVMDDAERSEAGEPGIHSYEAMVRGADPEAPLLRGREREIHRFWYTSATTGVPKAVVCPHVYWCSNIVAMLANQLADLTSEDAYLAVAPLTHMAGGYAWPAFCRGAVTVTMSDFDPARLTDVVTRHRISHTLMAPTMVMIWLEHLRERPEERQRLLGSGLRALWYAGSVFPVAAAAEAEEVFGPILNQQYGLSELFACHSAMCATLLRSTEHAAKHGSCGRPLLDTVVRVVRADGSEADVLEDGEVVVETHDYVAGYYHDDQATAESFHDGLLHTGDVGHLDPEGYLYITDRLKDMIVSGGFNIYSTEVENALQEHPAVLQCAVIAVPDPKWVEVPVAYVRVRDDGDAGPTPEELIAFCRERLAHFKAPRSVRLVNELPVSATGKVLKRVLRKEAARAMAGDVERA